MVERSAVRHVRFAPQERGAAASREALNGWKDRASGRGFADRSAGDICNGKPEERPDEHLRGRSASISDEAYGTPPEPLLQFAPRPRLQGMAAEGENPGVPGVSIDFLTGLYHRLILPASQAIVRVAPQTGQCAVRPLTSGSRYVVQPLVRQ